MNVKSHTRKQHTAALLDYANARYLFSGVDDDAPIRNLFTFGKQLGKGVQGVVHEATPQPPGHVFPKHVAEKLDTKNLPQTLAVKTSLLNHQDLPFVQAPFSGAALKKEPFIELAASTLANQLVFQKICPNFVVNYHWEIVTDCNKKRSLSRQKHCMLQYNEYVDGGTFHAWSKKKRTSDVWYNAFFQIMAGLHALRRYFNLSHTDLHSNNILVKRIPAGGYWEYDIEGVRYYVPNLGYMFMISDFGRALIPKKVVVPWYHNNKKYFSQGAPRGYSRVILDIKRLWRVVRESNHPSKEVIGDLSMLLDFFTDNRDLEADINDVLQMIYAGTYITSYKSCDEAPWHCYHKKKYVSGELIERYDLNKSLDTTKLPEPLRHCVQDVTVSPTLSLPGPTWR